MQKLYWAEHSYDEIQLRLEGNPLVILPVGSVEAHGYHLPLNTDMLQPMWLVERIAEEFNALILPPIHYGWTGGLDSFPGTISIGFDTLRALVRDILNELGRQGVDKVLLLSGHASGNHMAALRLACEDAMKAHKGMRVMLLSDYYIAYKYRGELVPENDGHAGVIETSRVMAIRPDLVKENYRFERKDAGKYMVILDYSEFVPYATFSDPEGSNAELGEKLNTMILEELKKMIRENFGI